MRLEGVQRVRRCRRPPVGAAGVRPSCRSCLNQSSSTWWMTMKRSSSCSGVRGCWGAQDLVERQVAAVGERRRARPPRRSQGRGGCATAASMARAPARPGVGRRKHHQPVDSGLGERGALARLSADPAGVTVISSSPSSAGPRDPMGGGAQPGDRRRRLGREPEAVPTLTARYASPVRGSSVPGRHDRDRPLHRTRICSTPANRRSGRGTPDARRTRGGASRRGTRRLPRRVLRSWRRWRGTPARGSRRRRRASPARRHSTSRLATCLASTTGLRCGRITMPVASRTDACAPPPT